MRALYLVFGFTLSFAYSESTVLRFEATPDNLQRSEILNDTGVWEIKDLEKSRTVFHLKESGKPPTQPVRKPANILLLPIGEHEAFQIDVEIKTTVMDRKGADSIVVFGYQDENHFYYAHISNDSDNRTHHIIMKVEGSKAIRTPIQNEKDPAPKLNGDWQDLRVTRDSEGTVAVFVGDMETPTLTAKDRTWLKGKIGIGSFNDPAMFDSIVLTVP